MCDCEEPKCWHKEHPRARQRHKCCECGGWIEIGEQYERFSGIWDDPQTFKTCVDCQAVRAGLANDSDCCIPFGGLTEYLCDSDDEARLAIMEEIRGRRRSSIPTIKSHPAP